MKETKKLQSLLELNNLLNKQEDASDANGTAADGSKLEDEYKRILTLERNRLAAVRSRRKKKSELDMLILSIRQLEKRDEFLDQSLRSLEAEKEDILAQLRSVGESVSDVEFAEK